MQLFHKLGGTGSRGGGLNEPIGTLKATTSLRKSRGGFGSRTIEAMRVKSRDVVARARVAELKGITILFEMTGLLFLIK